MEKVLGQVIKKIRDQRFLFVLVVVLVGSGILSVNFNTPLAVTIYGGALLLAALLFIIDKLPDRGTGVNMTVAVQFPIGVDPTKLNLVKCKCAMQDRQNPQKKQTGYVRPFKGGTGWLCPLPNKAKTTYVIDFTFTDSSGKEWVNGGFVPELQWPVLPIHLK